ncbi:MAG: DNA methylase [Candidatus Syntrophoarchaeum caldarius]|uniref:DNA methylase n=1 Tax=Candidatus Syntropharchaeum caldarium TaxID=1838285 RepID=A0A1F2P9J8_9EURY|nr:MAG: DNA methylase [Candidatus Syntrophoarchaeum caldarius]
MPYIERDFPIEPIDEIAWSESNARKPIYEMHKWFARRVGSTFRALILGTFLDDDPMKYYYRKNELKNGEGKPPIVLDPFMGGGTTIIEGHRLGCKMIGVDINPLAWFITKKEIEQVDKKKVEEEFKSIEMALKDKILSYYKTKCDNGHDADIMYVFWIRKIKCENCKKEVPLLRSSLLSNPKGKDNVYACVKCKSIVKIKPGDSQKCPYCGEDFENPYVTDKKYTCPHCGYPGDITTAWLSEDTPPQEEMFAIEYYCEVCGRNYKLPDKKDIERFERIKDEYNQKKDELLGILIPDQKVPWEVMATKRPRSTVYKYFHQFFNERQLLSLSLLFEEILKIKEKSIREFFLIVFSDCLNANNMFCIYNTQGEKLEPLFGGHYYSPPKMPVENNVWGTKIGRGTFIKYYKKGLEALDYQKKPFLIKFQTKTGKYGKERRERTTIINNNEMINGVLANDFSELIKNKNVLLKSETSEDMSFIPDNSVDAIISDPPYYDNIMYSELSDFFYSWLHLALKDDYPDVFGKKLSRNDREILVNRKIGKDDNFFIETLGRVFRECYRVLKDNGIMAFVFQHKRTEAWAAVLKALLKSGFYVVAVYPTHGETPSGVRAYGINYNSILVCRKLLERKQQQIPWMIFESELRSHVDMSIEEILDKHPDLEVEDAFIIAMGKALQVYSQNYGNIVKDGEMFDVSEVSMEIMGDIVFDSLLRRVLERVPDVDRISKIYASVFAKKEKITNDTINKLTRHGGIETDAFEEKKLVKKNKKKGIMTITPPKERKDFIAKKIEKGLPITYIDAAHLLWIEREKNGNFRNTLEMILRTGLEKERLEQYIRFMVERTNDETWKKIEYTFKSAPDKTLEDFGMEG